MSIFNFVKTNISIFEVVSQYASLKKAGIYWKGRCPFHHEKTASFTISPHKEIFYCFGCHVGGDVITFIGKMENCSPIEAAKIIAERYNINLPASISPDAGPTSERQRYHELCKFFAQWCHQNLSKHKSIVAYLHQRGFNNATIDSFLIGYLPGGLVAIKNCIEAFRTQQFLLQDLIDANIICRGTSVLYSPFEDRIIFPITDQIGRFCGFGGRIFKPDDARPKYYNSRENEHFIKGSLLFGLHAAKKRIQETGVAILVEGYTDCIAMVQHGFSNTIATLGTACSASQLKMVGRHAHTLFVLYDSDQAGTNAVLRLAQLCWQANVELKVIKLPQGYDPASFLAEGHAIIPLMENAQELVLFFIESLGTNFTAKPLREKIQTLHILLQTITSIAEPIKQEMLLQRVATILSLPFEAIKQEAKKINKIEDSSPRKTVPKGAESPLPLASSLSSITPAEKRLFCAIVNNKDLITDKNKEYIIDYMNEPLRGILKKAMGTMKNTPDGNNFHLFFESLDSNAQLIVSRVIAEHDKQMGDQEFDSFVHELQKKRWQYLVRVIKEELSTADLVDNQEEMNKLLQEFLALKNKFLTVKESTALKKVKSGL